jgi:hypothetical protein
MSSRIAIPDARTPSSPAKSTTTLTRALLACGVVAGPLFTVVALLQVLTRQGSTFAVTRLACWASGAGMDPDRQLRHHWPAGCGVRARDAASAASRAGRHLGRCWSTPLHEYTDARTQPSGGFRRAAAHRGYGRGWFWLRRLEVVRQDLRCVLNDAIVVVTDSGWIRPAATRLSPCGITVRMWLRATVRVLLRPNMRIRRRTPT